MYININIYIYMYIFVAWTTGIITKICVKNGESLFGKETDLTHSMDKKLSPNHNSHKAQKVPHFHGFASKNSKKCKPKIHFTFSPRFRGFRPFECLRLPSQ